MDLKYKMLNFQDMEEFVKNREVDLNDGIQHDITENAKNGGLPFVVFTTTGVWNECIIPDEQAVKKGETDQQRIQLILQKLIYAIRVYRQNNRSNLLNFDVDLTRGGKTQNVEILSYLGPVSLDNNTPCITLLLREELSNDQDGASTESDPDDRKSS